MTGSATGSLEDYPRDRSHRDETSGVANTCYTAYSMGSRSGPYTYAITTYTADSGNGFMGL